MAKTKLLVAGVILLMVAFTLGIALRPVILSSPPAEIAVAAASNPSVQQPVRGVQFFEANIDEARRVLSACREGTVRGGECANAETAVTAAESKERFRRFRKDR
ncbi:hypothetical protein [Blastomonas sp. UPD001]|uniref:hypothetical protein n=1 Tax=Blastomonas sp. UPD001 TaxID=2217673 RepID=UPI0013004062|nr:hypothetical protein [Blastomonas sp. UPD001]